MTTKKKNKLEHDNFIKNLKKNWNTIFREQNNEGKN